MRLTNLACQTNRPSIYSLFIIYINNKKSTLNFFFFKKIILFHFRELHGSNLDRAQLWPTFFIHIRSVPLSLRSLSYINQIRERYPARPGLQGDGERPGRPPITAWKPICDLPPLWSRLRRFSMLASPTPTPPPRKKLRRADRHRPTLIRSPISLGEAPASCPLLSEWMSSPMPLMTWASKKPKWRPSILRNSLRNFAIGSFGRFAFLHSSSLPWFENKNVTLSLCFPLLISEVFEKTKKRRLFPSRSRFVKQKDKRMLV